MFCFVLRKGDHAGKQERGRGRERIPSRCCTVSAKPEVGLKLKNRETTAWAAIKSQTIIRLNYPDAPEVLNLSTKKKDTEIEDRILHLLPAAASQQVTEENGRN